jgi:hypothetical protein
VSKEIRRLVWWVKSKVKSMYVDAGTPRSHPSHANVRDRDNVHLEKENKRKANTLRFNYSVFIRDGTDGTDGTL